MSKNTAIIIAGTTFTLQSPHTLADLEKVARYKPSAMTLVDENKHIYFSIQPSSAGFIGGDFVSYANVAPDGSGKACVTWALPSGDDVKRAIAKEYGPIIANANKVEAQIEAALAETNAMLADIEAQIVVAGAAEVPVAEAEQQ